ncbi:MAG: serine hydrolase domain-containing protein [Alphaproteobacteria bacterium]
MLKILKWLIVLSVMVVAAAYVTITLPWFNTLQARMGAFDATYGTPADHAHALSTFAENFPSRTVSRAGPVRAWPEDRQDLSHLSYQAGGKTYGLDDFFTRNKTRGLVIIHKGELIYERYAEGTDTHTRFTSMSVAKSVVATLVGLAEGDGLIQSLEDPLTGYLPELEGTAYEGVSIEQALQMSSGIKFTETYGPGDLITDIGIFMGTSVIGNVLPANEAAAIFDRIHEPGTVFNYNTAETQVLGALVRRVTGKSLSAYLSEKIWQPLGQLHDATWALDSTRGMEQAGCCLNMALRDYARLGELYRLDGVWHGQRLLPEGWVKRATQSSKPHVMPGKLFADDDYIGYQYQWWTRANDYSAQGVFGQFIQVMPEHELVIAMTSSWPEGWVDAMGAEAYLFFDAVAAAVAD